MMNTDVLLVLVITVIAAIPAYIGVEMANHPPQTPTHRKRYRVAFFAAFLLMVLATVFQAIRNVRAQAAIQKDSIEQQKKQSEQYLALKAKLDLIQSLSENPPAGTSTSQLAQAIKQISHLNLPAGELTNKELREKGYQLLKDMGILRMEFAAKQQELLDYWKDGVPDTATRHRRQEFEALEQANRQEFEFRILGRYVYMYQEILNRLPADKIPNGITNRDAGGWLSVKGFFTEHRDILGMEQDFRELLYLPPQ